jgi:hypothetical protein
MGATHVNSNTISISLKLHLYFGVQEGHHNVHSFSCFVTALQDFLIVQKW